METPNMEDIVESWFFRKEYQAREDNLKNAHGYCKVKNGKLVESRGITNLKYTYIKSTTSIKEKPDA